MRQQDLDLLDLEPVVRVAALGHPGGEVARLDRLGDRDAVFAPVDDRARRRSPWRTTVTAIVARSSSTGQTSDAEQAVDQGALALLELADDADDRVGPIDPRADQVEARRQVARVPRRVAAAATPATSSSAAASGAGPADPARPGSRPGALGTPSLWLSGPECTPRSGSLRRGPEGTLGPPRSAEDALDYSLGIDLGTTYSAAATARGDRLEIFQLGERAATIPSVIVLRADGEVLVGEAAERRAMSEPLRTAREFKRRLGDPTPIILGGTPYGAEALIGHLLRSIVAKVSEQLGGPPAAIAVCHPASYGEYKIDLLRQAVRQSDIGPVEFITEPQAAALHYALQERVPTGEVIAVYDFGGGTFDADDPAQDRGRVRPARSPGGHGATRRDRLRRGDLRPRRWPPSGPPASTLDPNDPATLAGVARLREECRRAKEGLSTDTDATIAVYLPGIQTDVRLTREEFESMIRPRIRETIAALERAARSAGLGFDGIDRILLVGGSSRIPLVAEMVREATHRPIALDAHPKHTMALGAAWVAAAQPTARGRGSGRDGPGGRCRLAVAGAGLAGAGAASAPEADGVTGGPPGSAADEVPAASDGAVAAAAAGAVAAGSSGATDPAAVSIGSQAAAVPITAGAVGPGPAVAPPAGAGGAGATTGRPSWLVVAAVAGIALVVVAAGAFAFLPRGSGGGAAPSSSAVGAGGPSLPVASALASPSGSASASVGPSVSPSIAASPTPTPAPTPTPTPAGKQARINSIDVSGGRYVVDYEVFGYTQKLPGMHVHFFFDTVPPTKAGMPAKGPWYVYAGPIPFKGYKVSDRPAKATQMCILVANPDHSVIQKTGNCVDLPN